MCAKYDFSTDVISLAGILIMSSWTVLEKRASPEPLRLCGGQNFPERIIDVGRGEGSGRERERSAT